MLDSSASDWVDQQTAAGKPAILMIFEPDDDIGFVYLVNGPAFGCPAVIALDVPRHLAGTIGGHLDFLLEDHRNGNTLREGQTSMQRLDDGYMVFRLVAPSRRERRELMCSELTQTRLRWPKAEVLLLKPEDIDERAISRDVCCEF
jgi:hypothetical protein